LAGDAKRKWDVDRGGDIERENFYCGLCNVVSGSYDDSVNERVRVGELLRWEILIMGWKGESLLEERELYRGTKGR
jgi:hypothetical protein